MSPFSTIWHSRATRASCVELEAAVGATEELALAIQQIPAPTFSEEERGRLVHRLFRELELRDVYMDEQANVFACLPGRERGQGLLVSAHLDTVFDTDTDLTPRCEPDRIWGPGIGDNSMGSAGLLTLASTLRRDPPRRDIWFVANVGEEGLGNLNGMWTVMQRLRTKVGAVVVLEGGAFGVVIHEGIGVQRRRLTVETVGGHAWSDFGTPSAIHELCRIGAEVAALEVPEEPRTSFNLGTIEGGTSINTIAARAEALLDLRSVDPARLQALAARVDAILAHVGREGVVVHSEQIGNRPAAGIPSDHPLVEAALGSLLEVGCAEPRLRAASTDANVPLSLEVPALCIGLTVGHNAHRLDEYVERAPLAKGLQHCYLTIRAALEWLP